MTDRTAETITNRGEVMNPPVPAAVGTEAGNLNTPHRHGTGAVPQGGEAQATQHSAAPIDFAALHAQQGEFCKAKGWPWFAPRVCWGCKREIYSHPRAQAEAATNHITGCYHCHKSYCD